MAVLVDDARWPAHGRLWAHLVSDTSLAELHAFARAAGVPARSFDADHYDVPDALLPALVAAGAVPVGGRELTRRLIASGLRVRQRDKPAHAAARTRPGWPDPAGTAALLLAAGGGTRAGAPGALARDDDGVPLLARRVAQLRAAGLERVLVVLGAQADRARTLLPAGVGVVVADGWERGMSASLQAGLAALAAAEPPPAAALVALLDPDRSHRLDRVARRVLAAAAAQGEQGPASRVEVLARAGYGGRAAHPVLVGRAHWSAAAAAATGERGAGTYLRAAGTALVECGDLVAGDGPGGAAPTLVP